jgi:hypothetical protein
MNTFINQIIRQKRTLQIVCVLIIGTPNILTADPASQVNFTVSLDTSKDPGSYYSDFHKAEAGVHNVFTIGFQIAINSVNDDPLSLSPLAAFCCELEEPISTSTYTFDAVKLSKLAAGQAGNPGTASSDIPPNGIGPIRAARVSYLFDHYYTSEALSEWTYTQEQPVTHAFQIALWELTHDGDLNITNTTGNIYIGTQSNTLRNNAIALAQMMLDDVDEANINSSYVSTNFLLWALVDEGEGGTEGNQDVILATKKDSSSAEVLEPLIPIPEPTVLSFFSLAGVLFWIFARIRRI